MPETALITGASSGLGWQYAKLFAADKKDVALVARRRERLPIPGRRQTSGGADRDGEAVLKAI